MPAYGKNLSPAETTALVAFSRKRYTQLGRLPAHNAALGEAARKKRFIANKRHPMPPQIQKRIGELGRPWFPLL